MGAGTAKIAAIAVAAAACGRSAPGQQEQGTAAAVPVRGVRAAPVIDSHVHLSFWPVAAELARAGVVAAVDMGAPIASVGTGGPVILRHAGPMLTRPGGYPIDAWDPGGFGQGCKDEPCVEAAVASVAARGGTVVKVAVGDDGLDAALVPVAVQAAHRRGMKVAAHALGDAEARLAADAGCDVLAHTPVAPLSDATIAAWSGRAVISSLAAFGGSDATVDNLRRLRAAGVTVLYGTDLGNTRVAGIDGEELRLLAAAGLDGAAVVAAMTTVPAQYWGLAAAIGENTYVRLARDPAIDPLAYTAPLEVWIAGKQIR